MYFSVSSGQSLVDQIEHAYSGLDSTSYINNVILSYGRFLNEINEESRETFLQILNSKDDNARTTIDYNRIDSIYLACDISPNLLRVILFLICCTTAFSIDFIYKLWSE